MYKNMVPVISGSDFAIVQILQYCVPVVIHALTMKHTRQMQTVKKL